MSNNSMNDYAMYIVVNNDLNMSKGKIAAQVGHVTEKIAERVMRTLYEDANVLQNIQVTYIKYTNSGRRKIILSGNQQQLEKIKDETDA